MGTGWRRAFCTTIPRDPESKALERQQQPKSISPSPSPSPRKCTAVKLGFLSGGSNPTTPRVQAPHEPTPPSSTTPSLLRCRTAPVSAPAPAPGTASVSLSETPRLECKTSTPKSTKMTPRSLPSSNASSPRSPLKLSFFKNSFKLRTACGVCFGSVKTGRGAAIYTAECGHVFHFACVADHVRKHGALVCPICNASWTDVPLLSIHKDLHRQDSQLHSDPPQPSPLAESVKLEDKRMIESFASPRAARPTTPKLPEPVSRKLAYSRCYDDDESLLSPKSGARFVPIDEREEGEREEQEEEVEEFQGFLVNPTPSCSNVSQMTNCKDSTHVDVKILPQYAVVSVSKSCATYVIALRVKAPPPAAATRSGLDPARRAPIDLVAVLDTSGSMTGAKLQMLKRAVRLVIGSLSSADRLSVVSFSAAPRRLLPLRRMTAQGQRAARRVVDGLTCGQGKSVGDALRKAAKVLEDRRERNPVASIILLSDGQDETVPYSSENQRQASSHVPSTRFSHVEIPVHASGFSKSGGGGFGREPSEDAFAKCIGGLLSVVVQDLTIKLGFASGSDAAEVTAVYSCSNGRPALLGSGGSVRLGDLYAEEERELLVELRVPTSTVGSHHVMTVRCGYRDPATHEAANGSDRALVVPRLHAVRSSDPKAEQLRSLFVTTRAVAESRRLTEYGDHTSAYHMLASARALLMQSGSGPAQEFARELEAELAELCWSRQQALERQRMIQRRRGSEREEMTMVDANREPLTSSWAWRAAEKSAGAAIGKKSLGRVSDLHGFENARF
ncbi:E3 ubiquitin-protein ligase WAV3 [Rhodamnia argentea]|uniref:E3 ubiquitin-protein ligase WAV3 n=1 Tax=Rhodamnia argentea TaxID=178133 RepID=A0A8B8PUS3_9MYRT|nr:E3 ubiquitin-protein ligase WAV3 [Rhodamnia argentea]